MFEFSDEVSELEFLNCSLFMWYGLGVQVSWEELDVFLDFYIVVFIGQYEVVKECVQWRELDLNKKNGGGWILLMYVFYIGYDIIVYLFFEVGVSVNVLILEGQILLMLVFSCGNESIVYFFFQ